MSNDRYVVFWVYPTPYTVDTHFETFETETEAVERVRDYSKFHPWNTYRLGKIVAEYPATSEEPPRKMPRGGEAREKHLV
jgi:hypothetical protein